MTHHGTARRAFLSFLAGSPLLAAAGLDTTTFRRHFGRSPRGAEQATQTGVITSAKDADDVLDFEAAAQARIPMTHWGYLTTGADDDATIHANREGYERCALRPRRLVDLSRLDTSVTLSGTRYAIPIIINPVDSQEAFHPIGAIGTARAVKVKDHLMVVSNVATTSIEDAIAVRGGPVWFQRCWQQNWAIVKQIVQRAEHAGVPALVFTVDLLGGSNRETMVRYARMDTRHCRDCHKGGAPLPRVSRRVDDRDNSRKPNMYGDAAVPPVLDASSPTWEYIERLKGITTMKVLVTGIVTKEDAGIAVQKGVNGIFVSNHGGRAERSLRATVTSLPEIVEGVETALALLRKELETVMKQSGTTTLAAITRQHVTPR